MGERSDVFEEVAVRMDARVSLGVEDGAERIRVEIVSPGYFAVMGRTSLFGRTFREVEARPDEPAVVVLSYDLWRRRFGDDEDAIGRSIDLNGRPFTVVGK